MKTIPSFCIFGALFVGQLAAQTTNVVTITNRVTVYRTNLVVVKVATNKPPAKPVVDPYAVPMPKMKEGLVPTAAERAAFNSLTAVEAKVATLRREVDRVRPAADAEHAMNVSRAAAMRKTLAASNLPTPAAGRLKAVNFQLDQVIAQAEELRARLSPGRFENTLSGRFYRNDTTSRW